MKDRKKFYIPRNFEAKFELFKGVGFKEILTMTPIIYVTTLMDIYVPFSLSTKIIASAFMVVLPGAMMILPAKRNNLKLYSYILWRIQFWKRPRTYTYRKEGWNNER